MKLDKKNTMFTKRVPFMRLLGYAVLIACLLPFNSCKKSEDDVTTVNVPVDKAVTIELKDILVEDGTSSKSSKSADDEVLNFFNISQMIYLDSIESLADVMQYQSKIKSLEVGTASITIIADDEETGTVIKDFVLTAKDASVLSIAEYELGTVYSENVQPFVNALILKLFQTKSVSINVLGKTNVTSGKNLKVEIELGGMVLTVNLK